MQKTEKKVITVRLNDGPVRVSTFDWPLIVRAVGDNWGGNDSARYAQADAQGELDNYYVHVRCHQDGRCLVYAWVVGGYRGEDTYAGELRVALERGTLAAAIRRVCTRARVPHRIADAAIADLPPVQL